jgi:hypothetical protein
MDIDINMRDEECEIRKNAFNRGVMMGAAQGQVVFPDRGPEIA